MVNVTPFTVLKQSSVTFDLIYDTRILLTTLAPSSYWESSMITQTQCDEGAREVNNIRVLEIIFQLCVKLMHCHSFGDIFLIINLHFSRTNHCICQFLNNWILEVINWGAGGIILVITILVHPELLPDYPKIIQKREIQEQDFIVKIMILWKKREKNSENIGIRISQKQMF